MDESIEDLFSQFSTQRKRTYQQSSSMELLEDKETETRTMTLEAQILNDPDEDTKFMNISTIINIQCTAGCRHDVAVPEDCQHRPLNSPRETPFRTFDFTLDTFQKQAITCIDNDQSVLISAHTSSGKTVAAEYAIAKCLQSNQRVIYTSPIKALSNQKYRDLHHIFKDVGLQTGDVTLDPNASCIVMTTEILRNMLYKGSEIVREVAWVIFDEIHYMRDKERGVVWEETIIMLPDAVRFVFLSATIPNALQFAQWVSITHSQPVHVIETDFRPVPLNHYIFSPTSGCLYLAIDQFGNLKQSSIKAAVNSISGHLNDNPDQNRDKSQVSHTIKRLSKYLYEKNFSPVIFFSFSKRECEYFARSIAAISFTNEEEKGAIEMIFQNALDSLSDEDKNLPQLLTALPLLSNGIGIHHSGLLPILKEITELLFSQGLIKFLFATETFSMGLNMPARCVVFTSYKKYDGSENRQISCGEYIQMSGRAGRRGIDEIGTCVIIGDKALDDKAISNLLGGNPHPLNSAFRLTYNMILNLLRIEGVDPEYMMRRSFHQYQLSNHIPDIVKKVKELTKELEEVNKNVKKKYMAYYDMAVRKKELVEEIKPYIINAKHVERFIQPGRILRIKTSTDDFGWGCALNNARVEQGEIIDETDGKFSFTTDVLINCHIARNDTYDIVYKPAKKGEIKPNIIPVDNSVIHPISAIRLMSQSGKLTPEIKKSLLKTISKLEKQCDGSLPVLDPVKDYRINSEEFLKLWNEFVEIKQKLQVSSIHRHFKKGRHKTLERLQPCIDKRKICSQIDALNFELKDIKSIVKLDDLRARNKILQKLGYINFEGVVQLKGKVACEISAGDELLLTELMFNGFFNDIDEFSVCAVLSCFLFGEKSYESNTLTETDKKLFKTVIQTAKKLATISKECGLIIDLEDYVSFFKHDLMRVFYLWAKGAKFDEICKITHVYEGTIIRCLRRCDELLKELIKASICIGNSDLEKKFKSASAKIKRNIAFSSSLYI